MALIYRFRISIVAKPKMEVWAVVRGLLSKTVTKEQVYVSTVKSTMMLD